MARLTEFQIRDKVITLIASSPWYTMRIPAKLALESAPSLGRSSLKRPVAAISPSDTACMPLSNQATFGGEFLQ